jgi:hypothetical protein
MRLKPLKISWKKLEQKLKLNKRNQTFFKVVWFRILSHKILNLFVYLYFI